MLFESHEILAAFTDPIIALTKEEADALARAFQNVQRHYPGAKLLSEKHMSLVALATCCGRIYGTRIAVIAGIKERPKPEEPEPEGNPIVGGPQFNGAGGVDTTQPPGGSWFSDVAPLS